MEEKITNIKTEKVLKRNRFNLFDSAYATVCFIILQIIATFLINIFANPIRKFQIFYFLAQFLVEAVFFVASVVVSSTRNVEFVKAETYNKKLDYRTALLAIAVSVICIFGFSSLTNVFVYSLEKFGYQSHLGAMSIPNFGYYVIYVFLMCVVPALFEETLFRGLILNGMREKGKTFAVMMSALIFMLMHGGPDQTIHQFILGIILGYVFVYSGTIWAPVLIHFLNNFYAVTAIYISGQMSGTGTETVVETLPSWASLALNLVIGIAIASISAYLIYLCVRGMIAVRKDVEKKEKEKFVLLLDKENLTSEELAWLKKYKNSKDEYADCEKVEGKLETEAVLQEVSTSTADVGAEKTEEKSKAGKKKSHSAFSGLLALGLSYLILQWILALISGF